MHGIHAENRPGLSEREVDDQRHRTQTTLAQQVEILHTHAFFAHDMLLNMFFNNAFI